MTYKLLLSLLLITAPMLARNPQPPVLKLQNKAYTLPRASVSLVLPGLAGAGALWASWRYIGTPLEQKALKRMGVISDHGKMGALLIKAGLLGLGAYKVQDYAATFIHRRAWPLRAIGSVQTMVNEVALLQTVYFHGIKASLADSGEWVCDIRNLIDQYIPFIEQALKELNDVSFELCDEQGLELIQALETDWQATRSGSVLPFTYEALIEAACDDTPLCVQLALLKKRPLGNLYAIFGNGVHGACQETLNKQKAQFNTAIKHCKRLAALQNGWDMACGGVEYAKYVVGEWWNKE